MAIFKCKMCGGALEVMDGATTGECQYCGTTQTLPKLNDDKKANMYDRANHFRRNNEFDKARAIYEQILNEDNTDAESYWSIILCQYGIEYVEDPMTHKRVPTVNRAQFTSVLADENYKKAIEHADVYQKSIYEEEAKAIDEIQKGILAISQKEEPFDVFICYKETDNNGRRTPDSVLANDLYHQLTQEGFKVFFSRITLEDKLGSAYEPYIFAALNSAKVMVVVGTKPEYFDAVWVKNEWSRYLALIKSGANKILIPAYRDMDPYDLPEEFSHLQAQDMSKLGFMQDLIRGIKKLVGEETKVEQSSTVVAQVASQSNVEPLLKRAFMFLEDFDWKSADEYAERVLDIDPENGQAYLCKFLAANRVRAIDGIKERANSPMSKPIATKALRFLDEKTKQELNEACEYNKKNIVYSKALGAKKEAEEKWQIELFEEVVKAFETVQSFKDSKQQIEECQESIEKIKKEEEEKLEAERRAEEERLEAERKAEEERIKKEKDEIYKNVINSIQTASIEKTSVYQDAINKLETISDWKDSAQLIEQYKEKIVEIEKKIEATKARTKKIAKIVIPIVCVVIAFIFIYNSVIVPNGKYKDAVTLMENGKIIEAYDALIALDGYKDSAEVAKSIYEDYKKEKLKTAKVGDYVIFGAYEQDNDTSNGKEALEWLVLDVKEGRVLAISKNVLDYEQYNTSYNPVSWETCTLRKWLNTYFINTAFATEEKSMIPTVTVTPDEKTSSYSTTDNETQDQVFLLSVKEAKKYFSADSERVCMPTNTARNSSGIYGQNSMWYLRSQGSNPNFVAVVWDSGVIYTRGYDVDSVRIGVRPAIWINLNS